jgi:hypothetical protein
LVSQANPQQAFRTISHRAARAFQVKGELTALLALWLVAPVLRWL